MFKWWKRRKEIKKMNALKKELHNSIEALKTLRFETIIGEDTETKSTVRNGEISEAITFIAKIIDEINVEVDDRTRQREFLFKEVKDEEDASL